MCSHYYCSQYQCLHARGGWENLLHGQIISCFLNISIIMFTCYLRGLFIIHLYHTKCDVAWNFDGILRWQLQSSNLWKVVDLFLLISFKWQALKYVYKPVTAKKYWSFEHHPTARGIDPEKPPPLRGLLKIYASCWHHFVLWTVVALGFELMRIAEKQFASTGSEGVKTSSIHGTRTWVFIMMKNLLCDNSTLQIWAFLSLWDVKSHKMFAIPYACERERNCFVIFYKYLMS